MDEFRARARARLSSMKNSILIKVHGGVPAVVALPQQPLKTACTRLPTLGHIRERLVDGECRKLQHLERDCVQTAGFLDEAVDANVGIITALEVLRSEGALERTGDTLNAALAGLLETVGGSIGEADRTVTFTRDWGAVPENVVVVSGAQNGIAAEEAKWMAAIQRKLGAA